MNQSGYLRVETLQHNLPYDGGFCKWYYAPIGEVYSFPFVLPNTQELNTYPTLISGKNWRGPINVPNDYVGYTETQKQIAAGIYYEQKLEFHQSGDNRVNRQILENMPYYQYIIIAKVRAGGYWVMIGNKEIGAKFSHVQDFAKGANANAKSECFFTLKSINKALVIPSFAGSNSDSPNGSTGDNNIINPNDVEKIDYITTNNNPTVTIIWNANRNKRFGEFPIIEIWSNETGTATLDTAPNITYNDAGHTPFFTINRTGVDSGFIIIK